MFDHDVLVSVSISHIPGHDDCTLKTFKHNIPAYYFYCSSFQQSCDPSEISLVHQPYQKPVCRCELHLWKFHEGGKGATINIGRRWSWIREQKERRLWITTAGLFLKSHNTELISADCMFKTQNNLWFSEQVFDFRAVNKDGPESFVFIALRGQLLLISTFTLKMSIQPHYTCYYRNDG